MPPKAQPAEEPYRHILVAVAGQTPQIITETLYALMVQRRPRLPVSEIYIITTAVGANIARRALLDPQKGQFFAFCREFGFDTNSIAFDEDHIITLKKTDTGPQTANRRPRRKKKKARGRDPDTADNEPMTSDQGPITDLDDIRTVKDNTALAQQLFGFIKQLAADPQTALHCSIAGGRKTMSAYMALALTLYGRQQDRLSHVLVTEQFESAPDFFFPPQRPVSIGAMQAGRPIVVNTKDARIELAEIPFVRLRQALGERFTALDQTVEETIQTVQQELNLTQTSPERLIIDLRERQVRFGATPISLSPMMLALYAYFAQTKTDHCLRLDLPACGQCTDCYQGFNQLDKDRFVNIYRRVYPRSPGQFNEWLAKKNKKGPVMDTDNYQSYISAANRQIESAQVSQQLKITSVGAYGGKRYGLGIDKNRIEIVDRTSV